MSDETKETTKKRRLLTDTQKLIKSNQNLSKQFVELSSTLDAKLFDLEKYLDRMIESKLRKLSKLQKKYEELCELQQVKNKQLVKYIEQVIDNNTKIEDQVRHIALAIKQNEYLDAYYPNEQGEIRKKRWLKRTKQV